MGDPVTAEQKLQRMRAWALGALVLCAAGMTLARLGEADTPWLSWVRAFCEAATIGALADWFAVVALFRHPLGIPIPHTAILPNNQKRVAESLADFMESNFLSPEHLEAKCQSLDYAAYAVKWLSGQKAALCEAAMREVPGLIAGLDDAEIVGRATASGKEWVLNANLSPVLGSVVRSAVSEGRDDRLFRYVLRAMDDALTLNREAIQQKIKAEIPVPVEVLRGMPGVKLLTPALDQIKNTLASAVAKRVIERLQGVLHDAEANPEHPLRTGFQEKMNLVIRDLQSSQEMAKKVHALQAGLAESAQVEQVVADLWEHFKAMILADCASADPWIRGRMELAVDAFVARLAGDVAMRASLNATIGRHVMGAVLEARPHIREWLVTTVVGWDGREMAGKLESVVGGDLQFIRLNGTIIGGLIGLVIHAVFTLFGR